MNNNNNNNDARLEGAKDASQELKNERFALPGDRLRMVNVNVDRAVKTVLGHVPKLRFLEDRFEEELPNQDRALLDRAQKTAHALVYAHDRDEEARAVKRLPHKERMEEVRQLRGELLAVAELLAKLGKLDSRLVAPLRASHSNLDVTRDLRRLADALSVQPTEWVEAVVPGRLERAREVSKVALAALGATEAEGETQTQRELREAFTRFVDTWQEVRRATAYLRFYEEDADSLAPSLYENGGGARDEDPPEDPPEPPGGPPDPPVDSPAAPSAAPGSPEVPH